tara:strand:+ start:3970 stop:4551 length:582 start_codon:yes stop_codon:yes gene_type:complete
MNLKTKPFKRSLRFYFKSKRRGIIESEWEKANLAIKEHLFAWDVFKNVQKLHSYISMTKHREVDTLQIINESIAQGKKMVVPIMAGNRQLRHCYLNDINDLQENYSGVLEPVSGIKADISDLDLVLVPLLAIDKQGTRLGYGAGFYDRFLAKVPTSTPKIGLLLEGFNVYCLPKDPWDIPLNGYISESGIHLL